MSSKNTNNHPLPPPPRGARNKIRGAIWEQKNKSTPKISHLFPSENTNQKESETRGSERASVSLSLLSLCFRERKQFLYREGENSKKLPWRRRECEREKGKVKKKNLIIFLSLSLSSLPYNSPPPLSLFFSLWILHLIFHFGYIPTELPIRCFSLSINSPLILHFGTLGPLYKQLNYLHFGSICEFWYEFSAFSIDLAFWNPITLCKHRFCRPYISTE